MGEPCATGKSTKATKTKPRNKTGYLKNPVQAIDIMMKNIELFQRALEKKQDNQFELVELYSNKFSA